MQNFLNSFKATAGTGYANGVWLALLTTGELYPVAGTPFDFRNPATIGSRVNADDEQIKFGDNWVINHPMRELGLDARVAEPTTGRVLEVWSKEPGRQFYSGNFLDGTIHGKAARSILIAAPSPWNRNIFLTRPIIKISRPSCFIPAKSIITQSALLSAYGDKICEPLNPRLCLSAGTQMEIVFRTN